MPVTPRKIPMRMCIGCGEMKPKKELVRVVKDKEGNVSMDLTGKKAGRGAYVCPHLECLEKAQKSNRLERAFSQRISDEVYESLKKEIANAE
ncbi:MAG: YlxR family protein [Clostridia bacterium]|nr:YlxR family protein [Clostridia bacterium]